jgi:hypothetical protein
MKIAKDPFPYNTHFEAGERFPVQWILGAKEAPNNFSQERMKRE